MPLDTGRRLGPYEIIAAIGAGGMGEVYRARDTRLNRDVAIKVLPEAFAADSDRLARFTREAQTLAALNHPNIAHIHGLEESPSTGSGRRWSATPRFWPTNSMMREAHCGRACPTPAQSPSYSRAIGSSVHVV